MRSVDGRELDRVSDEEYRLLILLVYFRRNPLTGEYIQCVEDKVLVALLREQRRSPSANVSHRLCRPSLRTDSRKSEEYLRPLTNPIEELCRCEVRNIMSDLKLAPSTDGRGVDHSFRNTLSAEMSPGFDELSILKQEQALYWATADSLSGIRVSYRIASSLISTCKSMSTASWLAGFPRLLKGCRLAHCHFEPYCLGSKTK